VTESAAILAVRGWLERIVLGLNLCPFAARPFEQGRIRYVDCDQVVPQAIRQALYGEIARLLEADPLSDPAAAETCLFILSAGLTDFRDYLDVLESAREDLEEAGLVEHLQLASFHPDYRFAGVPADDPANYSNRSPLPVFHLIRQDSLSAALAGYPDPERIPERNVARLRELGVSRIRALLDGGAEPDGRNGRS
jgi:hypothetical protein